jgi:hypothetical protein
MLKIEIGLDKEQILIDNKYEVNAIYNFIDELFTSENLIKEPSDNDLLIFIGKEPYHDFAKMFNCIFYLEKQDWFMDYVRVWNFYNNGRYENILQQSKEKLAKYGKVI